MNSASTGGTGDGKIFVTSVDEVLDIGSKQGGKKAIEMGAMPAVTA